MSEPADVFEEREVRTIARRYKRKGYRVTIPREGTSVPLFLAGFTPDLIAESEDDRVVIQVKRRAALRASNEITGLAECISREPGWRFERVTVRSEEPPSPPSRDRIEAIGREVQQVLALGLTDLAYLSAWSLLEVLLNDLALVNGLRSNKTSVVGLARDLVFRGIISSDTFDTIQQAYNLRNRVAHSANEQQPSAVQIDEILKLGRELRAEIDRSIE
jgi:hypothetical protein